MFLVGIHNHDNSVTCISFHPEKFGEGRRDFLEHPTIKTRLAQAKGWFPINFEVWKSIKSHPSLETREQIYYDGNNLKIDLPWEVMLMPPSVVKDRHIKKLNQKIQDQLNSENYDVIKILALNHEKDTCEDWDTLRWYERALVNIDERVLNGESDKPTIRQKLQAQINELKK